MSMAFSMKSWCHEIKNKRTDRSTAISGVKKNLDHVIKNHKDSRVRLGTKTREILQMERIATKKKVIILLKSFLKDRTHAREILATMRG